MIFQPSSITKRWYQVEWLMATPIIIHHLYLRSHQLKEEINFRINKATLMRVCLTLSNILNSSSAVVPDRNLNSNKTAEQLWCLGLCRAGKCNWLILLNFHIISPIWAATWRHDPAWWKKLAKGRTEVVLYQASKAASTPVWPPSRRLRGWVQPKEKASTLTTMTPRSKSGGITRLQRRTNIFRYHSTSVFKPHR